MRDKAVIIEVGVTVMQNSSYVIVMSSPTWYAHLSVKVLCLELTSQSDLPLSRRWSPLQNNESTHGNYMYQLEAKTTDLL